MKKSSAAVVTAAILLLLTGCAGTPEAAPGQAQDTATSSAEVTQEAAPATVAPTETEEVDVEKYFLESGLVASIELSDEDKLVAGYYACEQVKAGNLDVVAIEGATDILNRGFVADSTVILCPELASVYSAG